MTLLLLLACTGSTEVIEGNLSPSAVLLVPVDQGGLLDNEALVFLALLTDAEDSPAELEVFWTLNGEELLGESSLAGDILRLDVQSPGPGEHHLEIEVQDTNRGTGGAWASFTLTAPELLDADGDGFGDAAAGWDDCDDADELVNPEAVEVCDLIDNDCDGTVDEGFAIDWMLDADGDGYGDPDLVEHTCVRPGVLWTRQGGDCDDANAQIWPSAQELCDGADGDCDGLVDEGTDWYQDDDGDGFGDDALDGCDPAYGGVLNDLDCDDGDAEQRWCHSCLDRLQQGDSGDGLYTLYTRDGQAFEALCRMDEGWTLIATNTRTSEDWTPASVIDDSEFGLTSESEDHKSPAWVSADFRDVRFENDVEYAVYTGVGSGIESFSEFMDGVPPGNCGVLYQWSMTEGTLSGPNLCSTNLYINVSSYYDGLVCNGYKASWGPSWSTRTFTGCSFNLPQATGFLNDDLGKNAWAADEGPVRVWVR